MHVCIAFSCKEEYNDLCFSSEVILPLHGSGDGGVVGGGGGGVGGWGVRPCVVSAGFLYHHLINLRK